MSGALWVHHVRTVAEQVAEKININHMLEVFTTERALQSIINVTTCLANILEFGGHTLLLSPHMSSVPLLVFVAPPPRISFSPPLILGW